MKKIFAFCFLLGIVSQIAAQNVNREEAYAKASQFFSSKGKKDVQYFLTEKQNNQPVYYIFNAENGYAVVSADKRSIPILAYSLENQFDGESVNPAVQMWLDSYKNQIADLKSNNTNFVHPLWISNENKNGITEVKPLLSSFWGQTTNYNYYCPEDDESSDGHVVTGCVPTAICQLFYYFRFPESGIGSYSYDEPNYGTLSADFSESVYDYGKMVDKPASINTAISKLIADCGIACDIQYGVDGSGMYNHKAAYAMRTFFKYKPETEYVFRDSVDLDWDSLVVANLNQRIPLYYAGWSVPNIVGHGFVCDGYQLQNDTNYYFHFNFGWNGSADGYFYTDHLSPSGNNFNLAQELIAAYPDTANYSYQPHYLNTGSTTFTEDAYSFTDGSGNVFKSPANMDYTWYIQPQTENVSNLILYLHYDLVAGDTLFVSSPDPDVNYIFTDEFGYLDEIVNANNVTIRFKTGDAALRSEGFSASYVSEYPSYCVSTVMHTAQSGTVTDRSGDNDYLNFTRCKTFISVNSQSAIQLNFTQFDLDDGDYLYIRDRSNGQDTLLLALTGNLGTPSFTLNTSRLMLLFETDEEGTAEGWSLDYFTGTVSMSENTPLQCNVYPNPTENFVNLEIANFSQNSHYKVFDVYGKLVDEDIINRQKTEISFADYSDGIYFLHLTDGNRNVVKKVILQKYK